MTDRRAVIRFEIVGRLPGTVTAERHVVLHNISAGGALIETPWPVQQDSVLAMKLESQTHLATLEARVCRVRPAFGSNTAYLVGLQFTADRAAEELGRLIPISTAGDAQPT